MDVFDGKLWAAIGLSLATLLGPGTSRAVSLDAFGIKGGLAWMQPDFQYKGAELLKPDSVLGMVGGVYTEWKAHRRSRFNVLTEVLYVEKGYKADRTVLFAPGTPVNDRQVTARYLSLPVLLRSNVQSEGVSLYLFFGPSVEFLLGADADPILDHYSHVVITGHAGLGLEKEIESHLSLTIELRFNSEFSNAFQQTDEGPAASLESVRHYVLELQSGVRF
jgi:hypothetical protein